MSERQKKKATKQALENQNIFLRGRVKARDEQIESLKRAVTQMQFIVDEILIKTGKSYGTVQNDNYLLFLPSEDSEKLHKEWQVKVSRDEKGMNIAIMPR